MALPLLCCSTAPYTKMDAEQAEAALALAACSDEDGAVRCPLWRQVKQEARSMVSVGALSRRVCVAG